MIRLVPLVQHPSGHQHDSEALATMRHLGPGLAFTGALAVGLSFLETLEGLLTTYLVLGALVLPFLLGVRIRNACVLPAGVSAGATFASKTLLEVAVVFLGTWIDIRHIVEPGGLLLVAIPTGVGGGMAPSFGLSKLLGLNSRLGYLVAVRNAICGNSAIAAVAPVRGLPHHGNAAAPVIRRGLFCLPRVAHPGAPPVSILPTLHDIGRSLTLWAMLDVHRGDAGVARTNTWGLPEGNASTRRCRHDDHGSSYDGRPGHNLHWLHGLNRFKARARHMAINVSTCLRSCAKRGALC